MKQYDAVLFDLDGTLLNTQDFIIEAFNHTLGSHGFAQVEWSTLRHAMGKTLIDCYRHASKCEDTEQLERLVDTHRNFQNSNLHLSRPFFGAQETLQQLAKEHMRLAIVTSRGKHTAGSTLELAQLEEFFDIIITADDVVHAKPHPEALQKALAHMGISPQRSVMIGDSDVDIIAGKGAGAATIGVTYGFGGETIHDSNPDFVVNEIQEIIPIILG